MLGARFPTTPRSREGIRTKSFSMLLRLVRPVANMTNAAANTEATGITGRLRESRKEVNSWLKPNTHWYLHNSEFLLERSGMDFIFRIRMFDCRFGIFSWSRGI